MLTAESIFLIPGPTFVAELIVFLAILGLISKYLLPVITKSLEDRQEKIRTSLEAATKAQAAADEAAGAGFGDGLLQHVGATAGKADAVTGLEQCECGGLADAAARAGDDGDFVRGVGSAHEISINDVNEAHMILRYNYSSCCLCMMVGWAALLPTRSNHHGSAWATSFPPYDCQAALTSRDCGIPAPM